MNVQRDATVDETRRTASQFVEKSRAFLRGVQEFFKGYAQAPPGC